MMSPRDPCLLPCLSTPLKFLGDVQKPAHFFQVSRKGELVFEIPVSVLVILLLCPTRWLCLIALVIGLFSSFHYSFRGPDLGREAINNAMDKASDFAENIGKDKEKKNND